MPLKLAQIFAVGVALSLLTTVAGINIFVLFLLPLGAWAWLNFKLEATEKKDILGLFGLIVALCVIDVISNLNAGHALLPALSILLGDLRTFAFAIVLWPLFATHNLSKKVFWTLVGVVVILSLADLVLKSTGRVGKQMYFLPGSGSNMNGQILVGLFFVLSQMLLQRPSRTWRIAIASCMGIMMAGLFLASERRTGWILLLAGAVIWVVLNRKQLLSNHAGRWLAVAAVALTMVMLSSNVVHQRLAKIDTELQLFLNQTTEERIATPTSVGIRLQYDISAWQLAQESGWLGVGSLNFRDAFWRINGSVEGLQNQYSNPHNEYLYMLSTKGWAGLFLYLAVFAQACRMAMKKTNEVQRVGMLMMVFLFLLSITTNSMMVDMKEGHFAMLMMLVLLAPRDLDLIPKSSV